jgi:uncharacterized protein YaaR (DUF327 family)
MFIGRCIVWRSAVCFGWARQGIRMAKPIRKTPTLKGEKAENFIKAMLRTEQRSANKVEKELAEMLRGVNVDVKLKMNVKRFKKLVVDYIESVLSDNDDLESAHISLDCSKKQNSMHWQFKEYK